MTRERSFGFMGAQRGVPLLKSFLGFDKLNFPPGDYKAPYVADVTSSYPS
jgi:hypothetical protein